MIDLTTIVVVAVVVALVVLAVAVWTMLRRRRSARLRQQFGPEYERTVAASDDPRGAEKDLEERRRRHDALELRELAPEERDGFGRRWTAVQRGFVDDPAAAVRDADRLTSEVMAARGYPLDDTGDADRPAQDLSVRYPVAAQGYRRARATWRAHGAGRAGTEDLRVALTGYRATVEALLTGRDAADGGGAGPDRPAPGHDRNGTPADAAAPRRPEPDARRESRT